MSKSKERDQAWIRSLILEVRDAEVRADRLRPVVKAAMQEHAYAAISECLDSLRVEMPDPLTARERAIRESRAHALASLLAAMDQCETRMAEEWGWERGASPAEPR